MRNRFSLYKNSSFKSITHFRWQNLTRGITSNSLHPGEIIHFYIHLNIPENWLGFLKEISVRRHRSSGNFMVGRQGNLKPLN